MHGNVTQEVWRQLGSSAWFMSGSRVTDLQPGQASGRSMELHVRPPRLPGPIDISLDYWVEDTVGTISFVFPDPLDPSKGRVATYNPISFAQSSLPAVPASFATNILPLFRPKDISAMRNVQPGGFDLSSYQDVKDRAPYIYCVLAHPTPALTMPCDGPWPNDWVAAFKQWIDNGLLP
jgi:hypothetical protein